MTQQIKEQVAEKIQQYSAQPYTGANEIHSLYLAWFKEKVETIKVYMPLTKWAIEEGVQSCKEQMLKAVNDGSIY